MIGGCTSSDGSTFGQDTGSDISFEINGISGSYTRVEDPANRFVLYPGGNVEFRNAAGGFSGTYTPDEGNLKICAEESDGTTCIYAPLEADGSFVYDLNTYRKSI
jgi:hypothetical protein